MFGNALTESAQQALGVIGRCSAMRSFYLAGGTAAALHLGHRISYDLDFFTASRFDPNDLATQLSGEGVSLGERTTSPGTLKGIALDTRVSFFAYDYPQVAATSDFDSMSIASLEDIGLMKMTAIASRGARKDFVDLYFILTALGRTHLFDLFPRKFAANRMNMYHHARSLTYFVDADGDAAPTMLVPSNWDEIKEFFRRSSCSTGLP